MSDADGPLLSYTPMMHARLFRDKQSYRDKHFQASGEPRLWSLRMVAASMVCPT